MIPVQFVYVAAALSGVGLTSYIVDTLRGRSHPNRVTGSSWSVAPFIAFAAQIQKGVGLTSLLTFMVGFGPLLVLVASFVDRHAYARVTRFDLSCGSLSIVALVMWQVTGKGNVAIAFSLLADLLAAIPTIRKAYRVPHTETSTAYLCSGIERGDHHADDHHLGLRHGLVPRVHRVHEHGALHARALPAVPSAPRSRCRTRPPDHGGRSA